MSKQCLEIKLYRSGSTVLTPHTAAHLKERLELLRVLKANVHLLRRADFVEMLQSHIQTQDMPKWRYFKSSLLRRDHSF